MMKKVSQWMTIVVAAVAIFCAGCREKVVKVVSPNGQIEMEIRENNRALTYSLAFNKTVVIKDSPIGFDGEIANVTTTKNESVWKPVWGKRSEVKDVHNETTLDCGTYKLVVRAYDDGVAFRSLDAKGEEKTKFALAGDYPLWYFKDEQKCENLGPLPISQLNGDKYYVPMTIQAADDVFFAILEADLPSGDPLLLKTQKGSTTFEISSQPSAAWRVIMCAATPGEMVDSHLIELLNPSPAASEDFSWVKPGVMLWDWRTNGAKTDGFTYGMNYESWTRQVDFASENGIPYLLLDAGWYGPEFDSKSNPITGHLAEDVKKLIVYAKGKNVGILLYLNHAGATAFPLEKTIATYASWGAAGIKYGFMQGKRVEKAPRTRMVEALCAKYKMLVNFHDDPVHPTGQMRTLPNAITREYCHSQLDGYRSFDPRTFCISVFVNMLTGPIDMNNGLIDLKQDKRTHEPQPVPSTQAGEVARTIITFSGATIIPDIPEQYLKHKELLNFIREEKQPWRESKTLAGKIGQYIVMARQNADGMWLVGAATNEDARELEIPLSFLGEGEFVATILEDGPGADYRKQIESFTVKTQKVSAKNTIRVKLAPGGGACVRFAKTK